MALWTAGDRVTGRERLTVEDRRKPSAILIERATLQVLAEHFTGRRLPLARSLMLALIELAEVGEVDATRATIADYAGMTRKALDDYVPALEEAGLLRREKRNDGQGGNLPNVWVLLDGGAPTVPPGGHPAGGRHADDPVHSSTPLSNLKEVVKKGEGVQGVPPTEGGSLDTPVSSVGGVLAPDPPSVVLAAQVVSVEDEMLAEALEHLRRKFRVDGRIVTSPEMARAASALAAFNRQAGSEFGLGAHLRPIVMRIRERPAYDSAALVRLVESAWRIKWWEKSGRRGRRATPAVVFGNTACFENVVQDAIDEKKGRPPEEPGGGSRRFTRED